MTMASTSQTNPAYSVPSFNAHDRLLRIHQEITDFLHYQSHVRFPATTSIPPGTRPANEQEREAILELFSFRRYLVTYMTPSLYLLLDISYSLIGTFLSTFKYISTHVLALEL
jgi:hypothetical protein